MQSKRLLFTFLFFLILGNTGLLFAESKHFSQKLEWTEDENAFEYKVEIQDKDTGKSTFYNTEDPYLKISVSPGNYKYRVYTIDFLGKESSVSEWRDFVIVKALTPKVIELPQNVVVSPEKKAKFDIPVDVTSITKETEVVLVNQKTKKEIKGSLEIITESGEAVASNAVFPEVDEGEWKMKITNPSGLYAETEVIDVTKTVEKAIEIAMENPEEKRVSAAISSSVSEAEARAEQERLEKERKEIEKRLAEEAEAARIAEEARKAEEDRLLREAEAARIAEEKHQEEIRIAEEKRIAEENARQQAELKRIEEETVSA